MRSTDLFDSQVGSDMAADIEVQSSDAKPVVPVRTYDIRGAAGITLCAREWGNPDGPAIVFVHGWSQCDLCWTGQVRDQLARSFRISAGPSFWPDRLLKIADAGPDTKRNHDRNGS